MKVCITCKVEKPFSEFSTRKDLKSGPRLRATCRQCCREKNRKSYDKHKAKRCSKNRTFYKQNSERILKKQKRYAQLNPEKINAISVKYQTNKLLRMPKWLDSEQIKQIEAFYIECRKISLETNIKHHVDHIVPLQGTEVNGLHVPWNLQILTQSKNCSKGNKLHG